MSLPRDTPPDPAEARRRQEQDPLLSSVVRAADAVHDAGCPDAEWLALYADEALTADEARVVMPHLRSCERCQDVVGAYRRASADAPAGSGAWATPAVAPPREDAGALAGWLAAWRWLVPATSLVAVMVATVWIGRGPADRVAQDAQVRNETLASRVPESKTLESETSVRGVPGNETQTTSRPEAFVQPDLQARADTGRANDTAQSAISEKLLPAPGDAAGDTPGDAPRERDERQIARALPSAEARSKSADSSAATEATEGTQTAEAAAFRSKILALSWRARRGLVERTRDDGQSWETVALPDGALATAVASVSRDVCWSITADSVFRVVDGVRWVRTSRPSNGTLTSITADSAHDAAVVADGIRFVTSDGGITWTPAR